MLVLELCRNVVPVTLDDTQNILSTFFIDILPFVWGGDFSETKEKERKTDTRLNTSNEKREYVGRFFFPEFGGKNPLIFSPTSLSALLLYFCLCTENVSNEFSMQTPAYSSPFNKHSVFSLGLCPIREL